MAQSVLRYNVVIVGKFFNKGSRVNEVWRKEHPEETEDEVEGARERMLTAAERREMLDLDTIRENTVSVQSSGTPSPHGARLTPS